MSGARASNRQAAPSANGGGQIPPSIKRHLQFASMKPPFVPHEDYHRFSSGDARKVSAADREAEAIVVKSTVRFGLLVIDCGLLSVLCGFIVILLIFRV